MITHDIQIHILTQLLKSKNGLRYRDMKPTAVENDLYNYHLKYLVKSGLAVKDNDTYSLTDAGKQFVEEISPLDPAGQTSELFRVNVLAGGLRIHDGKLEVLNQKRTCHPFYGDVGIIGGPVKKGEKIIDAARRKFEEETGLIGEFTHLGVIRKLRYTNTGDLFSDILFHICFSAECSGALIAKNEFGENFWCDLISSINNEKIAAQGSVHLTKILEQLATTPLGQFPMFYVEETNLLRDF
jgi:ADP-ribose pyrophosphatase YjhB (NUDIX family)/predicted transcriptional regulator